MCLYICQTSGRTQTSNLKISSPTYINFIACKTDLFITPPGVVVLSWVIEHRNTHNFLAEQLVKVVIFSGLSCNLMSFTIYIDKFGRTRSVDMHVIPNFLKNISEILRLRYYTNLPTYDIGGQVEDREGHRPPFTQRKTKTQNTPNVPTTTTNNKQQQKPVLFLPCRPRRRIRLLPILPLPCPFPPFQNSCGPIQWQKDPTTVPRRSVYWCCSLGSLR